ncbi:MAG TPA: hypothetical protein VHE13_06155 [Opitutus sp.]|nr:hypothetical protein [Opitutus sp.]
MKPARILLAALLALGTAAAATRPPVLLIAGQSREEFDAYSNDVCAAGRMCPRPGGAAFYTSLDLNGVVRPQANVPGDNHQDLGYLRLLPEPLVLQVGLWLGRDQLPRIAAGEMDGRIDALYDVLAGLRRPLFLRIGYEFDGPHNRYPPADYRAAYRRIAQRMRSCRDILLVWHSFAMQPTYEDRPIAEWYPGDDVVDWIGLSYFQVGEEGFHRAPNRDEVLAMARARQKPVLIAEASAIRYTARQKKLSGAAYWDYWYAPFLRLIAEHPEIRAVSIIDVDWDSQRQHASLDWGDARIEADPVLLQRWRRAAAEPWWMAADQGLYDRIRHVKLAPETSEIR